MLVAHREPCTILNCTLKNGPNNLCFYLHPRKWQKTKLHMSDSGGTSEVTEILVRLSRGKNISFVYVSSTKLTGCGKSWSSLCCLRSFHGFTEMAENLVNPTHSKGFPELAQDHPSFSMRNDFQNDFLGRSVLVKAQASWCPPV